MEKNQSNYVQGVYRRQVSKDEVEENVEKEQVKWCVSALNERMRTI
jgi:hypothetical protein